MYCNYLVIIGLYFCGCAGFIISAATAAEINGPFITEFINDVSGSDVFKVNVGLTNIGIDSPLIKTCVTANNNNSTQVCSMIDVRQEFIDDFGSSVCHGCIITVGTFVFPSTQVPIDSIITACANKITENQDEVSCEHITNSPIQIPEYLVIKMK